MILAVEIKTIDPREPEEHIQWGLLNTYNGQVVGGMTTKEEAVDLAQDEEKAVDYIVLEMERLTY